jgi:hypothetical protein
VSVTPLAFNFAGFPARFGQLEAPLSTGISHTVTGPTDGRTYVIQGIDVSSSFTGVDFTAYYDLDGVGETVFYSAHVDVPTPKPFYTGMWRGALAVGLGGSLRYGISVGVIADLSISAWGLIVPLPYGGNF